MYLSKTKVSPAESPEPWIAMFIPTIIFMITLLIIFYVKRDKKQNSTYIFTSLMNSNLICLITITAALVLVHYFNITNWIPQVLLRIFLANNDQYIIFINLYIITIVHLDENKNYFNKSYRNHIILAALVCTMQLFLPVQVENSEFQGLGSIFSSVFFALDATFWIYLLFKYRKEITKEKIFQSTILALAGTASAGLSVIYTQSHVVTITQFAILYILYLKDENPDIKYINKLNKSKEETEKALSAKNDFLNSMTEELSDPLNKIIEEANDIYTYKDQVNEEVKDDIEFILPTSKNLYEIVGNIIDINKIENNQVKLYEAPYNPIETIRSVIDSEKNRISNPNIKIEYETDNNIPKELTGDETHVKQIVHNLVSNALKYTEEGKVTIIVTADQINYDTYNLKVKVIDTGIGIKNETLINLFTNFSKSTEQKNSNIAGTGLGLSITKKLVDLLNGTITVESIYGSGSTFTVSIPHKI